MKYIGLILNIPLFFILFSLGIAMYKSDIGENSVFGYRTKASKSSNEAWKYANKTYGKFTIIITLCFFLLSLILAFLLPSSFSSLSAVLSSIFLILALLFGILKLELTLRKKFHLDESFKIKPPSKILIFFILFSIVCIIGAIFGIGSNLKPFKANIIDNKLIIQGYSSPTITLNKATKISLLSSAPKVLSNAGGGSNIDRIWGTENLENLGVTNCCVENSDKDVILLKNPSSQYLIGFNSSNETINLYNKLTKILVSSR